MKLVISEKQLNELVTQLNLNKEITEQGEGDGAPEAGTSSDGEQKTGASKWESGVTRGPANQIGVTKWADSYKITRGRANPLSEQSDYMMDRRGNALLNATGIRSDKDYQQMNKSIDAAHKSMLGGPINAHDVNMVLGIAAFFIPYVGPFISAGIGMYDAKLYYDEGDKKTAGMIAMFTLMPGVGSIVSKIPGVKALGAKAMGQLGKKLSIGAKITNPAEVKIVKEITKNRAFIELELKKASDAALAALAKNKLAKEVSIKAAKDAAKKNIKKQVIKKNLGTAGKVAAGYTAAGVAYSKGYDKINGTPDPNKDIVARVTSSKEPPVSYTEDDMELVDGVWVPKEN